MKNSSTHLVFILLIFVLLTHSFTILASEKQSMVIKTTINKYQLPFKGQWLVFWGGNNKENNHHYDVPEQRYAYDFVKTDDAGNYHFGSGNKLENYYSYGENVYSPADGEIITIVDGIEDSLTPNIYFIPGNLVVIKHRGKEYSYIAHLLKNSIVVKERQKVKQGQLIAKCGDSGNSTMPHIHFQITDNPNFQNGKSLPINFENILVNEKFFKKHSPQKSDIVSNISK